MQIKICLNENFFLKFVYRTKSSKKRNIVEAITLKYLRSRNEKFIICNFLNKEKNKLIRYYSNIYTNSRACIQTTIKNISLYSLLRSRNLNFHTWSKHKQAEPLPSHRKQDPCCSRFENFNTSSNPSQSS